MWKDFPLFPDKATELAGEVDQLTFVFLAIALFFSLLVATLVVYFAIRYRRRSEGQIGEVEETGIWLEIVWSAIPLVILLGMFFWGAKIYIKAYRPPSDAVEYFVTGKQWMWKFQHPEGNREINHLHVPVGQRIRLTMTSEDVIHSFFVPAFRVKADVLPGRYTSIWFEANKTGTFTLFCAEFCGAEHSQMLGSIIVMEPQDYEQWLAQGQPEKGVISSGEALFSKYVCNTCHYPDSAARAPILHGIWGEEVVLGDGESVVVDANYVRESILEPTAKLVKGYQPLMPTYQGQVSEEELVQLISYVRSLTSGTAESQDSTAVGDSNESEGQ